LGRVPLRSDVPATCRVFPGTSGADSVGAGVESSARIREAEFGGSAKFPEEEWSRENKKH
jgi:hypothetical protein